MSISSLLEKIRERPGLYLLGKGITSLCDLVTGYQLGIMEYDTLEEKREIIPLDFFRYMSEFAVFRLNPRIRNMGWWHAVLEHCEGDEEKALNKFFELYDEFKQIKMQRYWKAVLSEENIKWCNDMEHMYKNLSDGKREPVFTDPIAVYVIELTVPTYLLAVETEDNVILEPWFFSSPEEAKRGTQHMSSAETYFGKIDSWEEVQAQNIIFDKKVTL